MNIQRRTGWALPGVLALVSAAVAQSAADVDTTQYKTYQGNRDQFTVEVPQGWQVIDQTPYSKSGVIAFYSQPIETTIDRDPVIAKQQHEALIQLLNDMTSGRLPTFFVDRYKADKGMACNGYDARAEKRKVKIFTSAAALGRKPKLLGQPESVAVDFGGCRGLKVTFSAAIEFGQTMKMQVYTAAVDGVTYDFALLTEAQYFEQNLPWFERMIGTVRLAGATHAG